MTAPTACPKCGTMLNDSGTEAATVLHTPHYYHNTERCRDVLHAKLEERTRERDEARLLVNKFLDCDDVGVDELMRVRDTWEDNAALERLRSHGK